MKLTTYTLTLAALMCIYTVAEAHDISFHTYQYGTGPLVIVAGATTEQMPRFNPQWNQMQPGTLIVTRNEWIPYPSGWPLYDAGIRWVIADYAMMWEGLPLYYQFDFDADGHVSMSDLTYFEREYGTRWDLSDYSTMGLIIDDRRR